MKAGLGWRTIYTIEDTTMQRSLPRTLAISAAWSSRGLDWTGMLMREVHSLNKNSVKVLHKREKPHLNNKVVKTLWGGGEF